MLGIIARRMGVAPAKLPRPSPVRSTGPSTPMGRESSFVTTTLRGAGVDGRSPEFDQPRAAKASRNEPPSLFATITGVGVAARRQFTTSSCPL